MPLWSTDSDGGPRDRNETAAVDVDRAKPINVRVLGPRATATAVASALEDQTGLEISGVTVPATLDTTDDAPMDADCLLVIGAPEDAENTADARCGPRWLTLRGGLEGEHALPIVYCGPSPDHELLEALASDPLAGLVQVADLEAIDEAERLACAGEVRQVVACGRTRQANRRLRAALESVDAGVAVIEGDRIVTANDRFAVHVGRSPAEVQGTPWRRWFGSATVDQLEHTAIPAAREGWHWRGTCPIRSADVPVVVEVTVRQLDERRQAFVLEPAAATHD